MKNFGSQHGVERAQQFLDRLARAAWEPFYKNEEGFARVEPARANAYRSNGERIPLLWEALARSMETFRALLMSAGARLGAAPPVVKAPHGFDIAAPGSNWRAFEYERILSIVASDSVVSVADAVVKTTAYLSLIKGSMHGHRRYLFRGQSDITRPLVPRLGRRLAAEIEAGAASAPSSVLTVSQYEMDTLTRFQDAWPAPGLDPLDKHVFGNLAHDDPVWWVLMQHYADTAGHGSRMLDVTTSLLMALLFACVDWDTGTVSTGTDGVVYVFVEGQNAVADDFLLRAPPRAQRFFDATADIPHMVINPPHNERSKAQSGAFIWWPQFWRPLESGLPYLRIHKTNKRALAEELLSFGVGPKDAVRGSKGLANESALRLDLGLPRWAPREA